MLTGRAISQTKAYIAHIGQKRRTVLRKTPQLKQDVADRMSLTSQLIYEYLLERQRHGVHEYRLVPLEPRGYGLGRAADYERLEPAGAGDVQQLELGRYVRASRGT